MYVHTQIAHRKSTSVKKKVHKKEQSFIKIKEYIRE